MLRVLLLALAAVLALAGSAAALEECSSHPGGTTVCMQNHGTYQFYGVDVTNEAAHAHAFYLSFVGFAATETTVGAGAGVPVGTGGGYGAAGQVHCYGPCWIADGQVVVQAGMAWVVQGWQATPDGVCTGGDVAEGCVGAA